MKKKKYISPTKRIVKTVGSSLGIILDKEYCEVNNIELGDIMDFQEIELTKK